MSTTTAPALFVLERPTDMAADSPWQKVDEAWTPKQAQRKRDARLKSAAMDHRTVDVVIVTVGNWADQFNPEKPFDLAPPVPLEEVKPAPTVLDDIRERNATGGVAAPEAASVAATPPRIEKIPFECGNILRDFYTGNEVRVTAVYDSESRRGFDWESADDSAKTGFCPAVAVQYFEFVEKERKPEGEPPPPPPPAPIEPEKPLFPEWPPCPFLEKDILRDVHTGKEVRVTKVFLPSRAGLGFKWETLDGKETGKCPIKSLACFVLVKREQPAAPGPAVPRVQPEAARAAADVPPPLVGMQPGPIDAIAGVTPLPFDVGATLRDIHTNRLVRVTGISPADGSGRGFDWETVDGEPEKGNCPINSIGCFDIVPDEPAAAAVVPGESPAPETGMEAPESGSEPPADESKPAETESPAADAPPFRSSANTPPELAAALEKKTTQPARDRRPPAGKKKGNRL